MNIKISSGNSKMGKISSISLPAVLTCRDGCLCKKKNAILLNLKG